VSASALPPKRSMLWVWPPDWDPGTGAINATQLAAIKTSLSIHRDAITVIGTVGYSIDPAANGWWSMRNPGVATFNAEIRAMGFPVHPLIGALDPTRIPALCGENITSRQASECSVRYFRQIWASPGPFIAQAVELLKQGSWEGLNIDFEGPGTPEDAVTFAAFLGKLTDAIHAAGGRVSVDTFSAEPYLNAASLAAGNSVDTFCDMMTYALHDVATPVGSSLPAHGGFENNIVHNSNLTGIARYGLGVCPGCCNPCLDTDLGKDSKGNFKNVRWHTANLTKRFEFAAAAGVREVDIWTNPGDMALGDTCADATGDSCWWKQIRDWLKA